MKLIRTTSFLFAATVLVAMLIGTLTKAINFGYELPTDSYASLLLLMGFYETLGQIGLNYEFWGWNGPFVSIGLLILVLINSIT